MNHPYRDQAVKLHRERMARIQGDPDATPELAQAWHSLQLHWLRTVPSYRAEVQARVLEAMRLHDEAFYGRSFCVECGGSLEVGRYTEGCRHCQDRRQKHRTKQARNGPIDRLGQEIEGCG